jgi:hypothetical protein
VWIALNPAKRVGVTDVTMRFGTPKRLLTRRDRT